MIAAAGRHPNAAFVDEASDVPPGSQHATDAAVAVAGAASSDVHHPNTTNSGHIHSEPKGDVQGLDMRSNEHRTRKRDKRKGAGMDSDGAQKKQRSAPCVQAQQITQITPNQQSGSRSLQSSQTQSPQQCTPTALQSADSDVARGCIALLALHRTTAEGMSIDSDDANVVGGLMQISCRETSVEIRLDQQQHNSS